MACKLVKKYWLILTKAVQFKPTFSKTDMYISARQDNCLWKMRNSFKVMNGFADKKKNRRGPIEALTFKVRLIIYNCILDVVDVGRLGIGTKIAYE